MKKLLLSSSVAAAVMASGYAQAAVDLTASDPTEATYASEIAVDTTNGTNLTNAANNVDVVTAFGFAASAGTTRFLRYDLDNGAKFAATPAVTCADDTDSNLATTVSAGGNGASFVIFEVSDSNNALTASGKCTMAATTYEVFAESDVTVTYAQYETAGNASNQNSALATDSGAIINFASALDFTVASTTPEKIDVTQGSQFFETATGDATTKIGDVELTMSGSRWTTGVAAVIADVVAAGTDLVVSGDFSATQNDDGTFGTLNRVFIDTNGGCDSTDLAADELNASTARLPVGADLAELAGVADVCMTVEGTPSIPKTTFTGVYDAAAATNSDVADNDLGTLSTLVKNGSETSVNLALTPGGAFRNFIRIQNLTSVAGDVFITVYNDLGNSVKINLNDISGITSSGLGANSATKLMDIQDIFAAAQAKDSTFDVGATANKLRLDIEGEFKSIDAQAITLATDNSTFTTF